MGNARYQKGDSAGAISYFKKALAQDDTMADVHYNLGNAYYLANNPEDAISHYQQAITLNPQKPESHYNLGNALSAQCKY